MNRHLSPTVIFLLIIFSALAGYAQDIPEPPSPPRLVNDLAGILTPDQVSQLENRLVLFNDSTSTQIAVVIVPSLNGYDKADFTYRLAEKWGVGQKGKNNGIVVMIKPKTSAEKGEAFIASGYGLEGVVPDITAKRIIENEMIPHFARDDYYGGINAGVNTLMGLVKGEYTAEQYNKKAQKNPVAYLVPIFIMLLVFFIIRVSRARSYSVGKSLPFWTAFWLLGSMGRGSHSGTWNSFSSGSGGFGGGGGGGFGGFGGGSFGGGGAGGSW